MRGVVVAISVLTAFTIGISAAPMIRSAPVAGEEGLDRPSLEQRSVVDLVAQLGAAGFDDREAAEQELRRRGATVRQALEQALGSPDAEIRLRAERCLRSLVRDESVKEYRDGAVLELEEGPLDPREVFLHLADRIGRAIVFEPSLPDEPEPIRPDVRRGTPFSLLIAASRALGRDFDFEDRYDRSTQTQTSVIRVAPTPRSPYPRSAQGPFLASVLELIVEDFHAVTFGEQGGGDSAARSRVAKISLDVRWEESLPLVGRFDPRLIEAITLAGDDLLRGEDRPSEVRMQRRQFQPLLRNYRGPRSPVVQTRIELIPIGFTGFRRLAISIPFVVPLETAELIFDTIPEEIRESVVLSDDEGMLTATLTRTTPRVLNSNATESFSLSVQRATPTGGAEPDDSGSFHDHFEFFAIDANGKRHPVSGYATRHSPQGVTDYILHVRGDAVGARGLAYRYLRDVAILEPTFVFENIVLPD